MDITNDIKEAIQKNLPAAVGTELQQIIKEHKEFQEVIKDKNKEIDEKREEINTLVDDRAKLNAQLTEVAERTASEKVLELRAQSLDLREAVIDLREKHADEKVAMMGTVVGQVFASNKLDYNFALAGGVSGQWPMGKDQYGCDQTGYASVNANLQGGLTKSDKPSSD